MSDGKFREPVVPPGAPLLYKSWANYPVYNFSYSIASDVAKCGEYTINSRFVGLTGLMESAAMKFGIACEEAVVENVRVGGNPEEGFSTRWIKWKDINLDYGAKDVSWSHLFQVGKALMRMWLIKRAQSPLKEILERNPRFGIVLPEDPYATWYNGTRLDYVADMVTDGEDGGLEIWDMKTSGSTYAEKEETAGYAALDPQLLTGALVSGIRKVGFIALVKTASPKIDIVKGVATEKAVESVDAWLKEQYEKLLHKRLYMRTGVRWPNDHCKMCDYLPKCLGNEDLVKKTLRVKESKATIGALASLDSE